MKRQFRQRLTALAAAFALAVANVVMPAQAAFATDGGPTVENQQSVVENTSEEQLNPTSDNGQPQLLPPTPASNTVVALEGEDDPELDYEHKATLCHATNSATNPYVSVTVDYNSFLKAGHNIHDGPVAFSIAEAQRLKSDKIDWGDIIPAVPEWGYPGKNNVVGAEILEKQCQVPEGEPEELPTPQAMPVDPCGLDNAYWDVDALNENAPDNVSYFLNNKGELVAVADKGYVFEENGKRQINLGLPKDSGALCEVRARKPKFVDNCSTTKDFYRIKATENVVYLVDGQPVSGKNLVTDASQVTVTAVATSSDYTIVNNNVFTFQFTDEVCPPEADLDIWTQCTNYGEYVGIIVYNPTDSDQDYEVVVTDSADNVVHQSYLQASSMNNATTEFMLMTNGEYTVTVYSWNGQERGEMLSQDVFTTTCASDDFTPEIYKYDQNGKVLTGGSFTVEVCQDYRFMKYITLVETVYQDEWEPVCTTYLVNGFGDDGQWFKNNVDYDLRVPTTVTITETTAPEGCELGGPWTFAWTPNYRDDISVDRSLFSEGPANQPLGSWGTGSNVFALENNCPPKVVVNVNPASTERAPVQVLAATGEGRAPLLTLASAMILTSIALAISPRLRRGDI